MQCDWQIPILEKEEWMRKWYVVQGRFEFPVLAEDENDAYEQAEEAFNAAGFGIMDDSSEVFEFTVPKDMLQD